jgi:ankyrin repeat protein
MIAVAAGLVLLAGAAAAQNRNINFDMLQAARAGSEATVRALLDQGANPNSRNRFGDSALNTAARTGNLGMAKLMVERGADVNLANLARVTPLMSAAFGGHVEILKVLLVAKAHVVPTDRVEKTRWCAPARAARPASRRCSAPVWT